MTFFKSLGPSLVNFNDLEAINSVNKALISQKIGETEKKLMIFFQKLTLIKFNDIKPIS